MRLPANENNSPNPVLFLCQLPNPSLSKMVGYIYFLDVLAEIYSHALVPKQQGVNEGSNLKVKTPTTHSVVMGDNKVTS